MKFLSTFSFILLVVISLFFASSSRNQPTRNPFFVAACNETYCNSRGNGSVAIGAVDNCSCECEWPYFGYRCLTEITPAGVSVLIDCNTRYGSNESMCNASSAQCYWNSTTATCDSKYDAVDSNMTRDLDTGMVKDSWCHHIIPMPYELTVYCFATIAFGVGGIGTLYMLRYRNTYSIVEENGERMFNQFYENRFVQYGTLLYCFLLFLSAGILAITAFMNFQDPSVCIYVYFFYAYVAMQVLCILWPIGWCLQFIGMYFASIEKKRIDLDTETKPKKLERETDRKSCQLRCF